MGVFPRLLPCCTSVYTFSLRLMGPGVQCVVCVSCQRPRGMPKVSGLNKVAREDGYASASVAVGQWENTMI